MTFQSTRPCGARLLHSVILLPSKTFQSTRPCGARRYGGGRGNDGCLISIHAPVWGATFRKRICIGEALFQSTRPCGARHTYYLDGKEYIEISIHAPVWGATVPVYTGLITAVALYFSRTSFSAVLLQAFFVAKSSV